MWNLEEAVSYYKKQGAPSDQSALVSLLREVQQEEVLVEQVRQENTDFNPRYIRLQIIREL